MNPSADKPETIPPRFPAIDDYIDSVRLTLLAAVKDIANTRGLPAYLVGGPVRDMLLGLPVKDLDIVVQGDAPALAKDVANLLGARCVIHVRFGTATVFYGDSAVDLVTARREKYPKIGALPQVEPSTLPEDLARRDFSVNAMASCLADAEPGLIDPLGGRDDLRHGLIRTLHRGSFQDDPTRMLRAVRYEQRLEFRLEPDTGRQLATAVYSRFLDRVSGDRIRHELDRIFEECRPARPLVRAVELGVLPSVIAHLNRTDGVTQWESVAGEIDPDGHVGKGAWLAALAFPLTSGEGEEMIRRLNPPSAMVSVIRDTIQTRELSTALAQPGLKPSDLCSLLASKRDEALYVAAGLTDSGRIAERLLHYLRELRHVGMALGGNDLMCLGVPGGPAVGDVMSRLRRARLDGEVNDEGEERNWVRKVVAAEYTDCLVG